MFSTAISLLLINIIYVIVIRNPSQKLGFPRHVVPDLPPPSRWLYADTGRTDTEQDIVLLGDSYLEAIGDDFSEGLYNYSLGHFLHQRTGWHVFQAGTSGSYLPRQLQLYSRALDGHYWPLFQYRPLDRRPTKLVAFFYEGNDLDDVFSASRKKTTDELSVVLPWRLRYLPLVRLMHRRIDNAFDRLHAKSYALYNYAKTHIGLLVGDQSPSIKHNPDQSTISPGVPDLGPRSPRAVANVQSGCSRYLCKFVNRDLQAPALELSAQERSFAIRTTVQSLIVYARKHPSTKICLIYLPSPSAIYAPPYFRPWRHGAGSIALGPALERGETALAASRAIRTELFGQLAANKIEFLDATQALQAASNKRYLHGRDDVNHFNRYGYQVVAGLLASSHLNCLKQPV